MEYTNAFKSKFGNHSKLWRSMGMLVLVFALFMTVIYTQTQSLDLRSKAAGSGRIQFVDHSVAKITGKNMFITVAKPNNIRSGDILVAMIGSDYAHVASTPSGWKLIRQ